MVYSVQQVKYEILAYIKEFGGHFGDYYVGIASDPKEELFSIHNVDKTIDPWLYKQLLTAQAAQTAQSYFINRLKTDGDVHQIMNDEMDCVYVYKKNKKTKP